MNMTRPDINDDLDENPAYKINDDYDDDEVSDNLTRSKGLATT